MPTKRKYWGWGNLSETINPAILNQYILSLKTMFQVKELEDLQPIPIDQLALRSARFSLPKQFQSFCSDSLAERAAHSYGKSFRDVWRGLHGQFDNPPDYVAFPNTQSYNSEGVELYKK